MSVCTARTRRRNGKGSVTLLYAYGGFRASQTGWIRETYRERFGIETSYPQMNQARIFSCTRHPLLRYFYVAVALVLRNIRAWLHYLSLSTPRRGRREIRLDKLRFRTMLH